MKEKVLLMMRLIKALESILAKGIMIHYLETIQKRLRQTGSSNYET